MEKYSSFLYLVIVTRCVGFITLLVSQNLMREQYLKELHVEQSRICNSISQGYCNNALISSTKKLRLSDAILNTATANTTQQNQQNNISNKTKYAIKHNN